MIKKNKVHKTIFLPSTQGFTLIELMVVLGLFSVVMAGLYSAYTVQLRQGVKEYRVAESEMEMVIARNIIERDISMAGYGLAEDYDFDNDGIQNFTPMPASATEGTPDTLTLRGTAIGRLSRSAQAWSYISDVVLPSVTYQIWSDAREDLRDNDAVIVMEPSNRRLWADGSNWLFKFKGLGNNLTTINDAAAAVTTGQKNYLVYGFYGTGTATQPYYAVSYYLGGTTFPSTCAPNTKSLQRAESRSNNVATGVSGEPVLNCVKEIQVAFGLDTATTDGSGPISAWDNGGQTHAASYTDPKELKKRLKQIRMYALVQQGNRDSSYTYANPDPDPAYRGSNKIRVGELSLVNGAVGRDVTLDADQMNYRWRVVSFIVTPRNIR